jgi:signal transduction histidine kinase
MLAPAGSEFSSEREQEVLRLLARASNLLADCLDYEATLNQVLKLVVSSLATWCAIDLVNEDLKIERVAVAHRDITKTNLAHRIQSHYPASPKATRGVYKVIETGKSILIPNTPDSSWAERADDAEHLRLLLELGSSSYMCVPLIARSQVVGSIMLLTDERIYDEKDLQSAEALVRCIAMAVDNVLMFRKMQKAIQVRDEFLAIATHEIRTPLAPIVLHLELIEQLLEKERIAETDLQRVRNSMGIFHKHFERLTGFINKILDLSRIDSNQMNLSLQEVNLSNLAKEVSARFVVQLAAHGRNLHHFDECDSPLIGMWDSDRLEQVICNLISNAIKYGEKGPIEIRIFNQPGLAVLEVKDYGIGIAEGDQQRIFQQYERVNTELNIPGMGLGMYISQQIIKAHGGEITVKSRLGEGSIFAVHLPLISKGSMSILSNHRLGKNADLKSLPGSAAEDFFISSSKA